MSKPSPGPWTIEDRDGTWFILDVDGGLVAIVLAADGRGPSNREEGLANARLIGAATDLLEACEGDLDPDPCELDHHGNCQSHGLGNPCSERLKREAIAKAKGGDDDHAS